jgi:murein DD-endopeptidase MepM/ murein hydrolase activator NlpD
MRNLGWTVPAALVALGSAFIIRGTETGNALLSKVSLHQASLDILYSEESPFRSAAINAPDTVLDQAASNEAQSPYSGAAAQNAERVFAHKIARGDTLASFWSKIGGAGDTAEKFFDAFAGEHKPHTLLRAGESVSVTQRDGEVVEVRRKLSGGDLFIVSGSSDEGYRSRIEKLQITARDRQVTGVISSSLVNSAESLGIPYSLVDEFVDLFSSRVEFRKDLQPGDTFTILFEERVTEGGEELEPGAIKAASIKVGGQILAVVRDVDARGTVRYFDEKGRMPTSAFLRYPLKYTRISSMFSTSRLHPVLHIKRPHNGVDFSAPTGTPVRTIGDGVVIFSGYNPSMGNTVKIAHGDRYTTEYMHLSKIDVKKGARVSRGAVIGAVGKTGLASGPHLHFGLFDKGKYIDPLKSKISDTVEEIRAPKAVLAMISDIKKLHETITVASNSSSKKKA